MCRIYVRIPSDLVSSSFSRFDVSEWRVADFFFSVRKLVFVTFSQQKLQTVLNYIKAFFICQPRKQTDNRWKLFTSPSSSLPPVTFVLCGLEPRCLALNCWDPDLDRAGIVSVFCVYGPNILMCIFVFVPLAGDSIDSMIAQLSPVVLSRARAPSKTRPPYGAPY